MKPTDSHGGAHHDECAMHKPTGDALGTGPAARTITKNRPNYQWNPLAAVVSSSLRSPPDFGVIRKAKPRGQGSEKLQPDQ